MKKFERNTVSSSRGALCLICNQYHEVGHHDCPVPLDDPKRIHKPRSDFDYGLYDAREFNQLDLKWSSHFDGNALFEHRPRIKKPFNYNLC
jgi:hypothetical protein